MLLERYKEQKNNMSTTQDITKAAKELASLERKLTKLVLNQDAAVAKATAKATGKYEKKISDVNSAVAAAKKALQTLAASA